MLTRITSRVVRVANSSQRFKSTMPNNAQGQGSKGEMVSGFAMYASLFCMSGIAYMAVNDKGKIPPLFSPNAPTQSACVGVERTN
ncbi:hypothetical protein TrST_g6624 [Triparma strigata]|uniref:Uncharacterized protein n=1 Tax=Triparma strigata TaxID=1606541 RepID=A0A9W7EDD0_9STRA|nr:hypothetical protein TrST_g6624 [Triparma strigata]